MPEPAAGRGNPPNDSTAAGGRGGRAANAAPLTPLQTCVTRRVTSTVGMQKTSATAEGQVMSNVDALYRLALGLDQRLIVRDTTAAFDAARGWTSDTYRGLNRLGVYGTSDGKRHAFVRIPDRRATVIILTNDDAADAKALAERIADRLLSGGR